MPSHICSPYHFLKYNNIIKNSMLKKTYKRVLRERFSLLFSPKARQGKKSAPRKMIPFDLFFLHIRKKINTGKKF